MTTKILIADYLNPQHGKDIVYLLNDYANDLMGGGTPLTTEVTENLTKELAKLPHAFTVICYVNNEPAGLINCFEAFSTFKCQPLLNIHDVTVKADYRGRGISQLMLKKVEELAKEKGCCKITLEVLEGNKVARNAYLKYGFEGYELDPSMGKALFWQKTF